MTDGQTIIGFEFTGALTVTILSGSKMDNPLRK